MTARLAIIFALLAAGTAFAQTDPAPSGPTTAAQLVKEIALKPGIYQQNCGGLERDLSLAVAVSLRGCSSHSQYLISVENFTKLRQVREAAIQALNAWLEKGGTWVESDEKRLENPGRSKMLMLVDLNAAESLPLLKKLAERLGQEYANAGSVTEVDWNALSKMTAPKQQEAMAKVEAKDRFGDVLSAIAAILRAEKFPPLLESKINQDTEAGLGGTEENSWMASLLARVKSNGGKIPEPDRAYAFLDPQVGTPVTVYAFRNLQVTPGQIQEILGWVDEYGKLPAEKRLNAKGILPWPVNR